MGRVCADIGVIENFKGRTQVLDEALSEGKSSVEAFFQEVSARLEAESERIKSVRSKLRQSIQYAESRINALEEENAGYEETISALNSAIAAELAKTTTDEDGKEVPAGDTAKIREWEAEIARLEKLIEKNNEKISQLNDWKEKAEDCQRRAVKQAGILAEVIFAVVQAKSEIPLLLQQMQ